MDSCKLSLIVSPNPDKKIKAPFSTLIHIFKLNSKISDQFWSNLDYLSSKSVVIRYHRNFQVIS